MAHSGFDRRSGSPDMVTLIVIATIVLVIAAVVADPVLSGSIGRILGTAWSESVRFLVRLVSRTG
jgi:hypothetical protein